MSRVPCLGHPPGVSPEGQIVPHLQDRRWPYLSSDHRALSSSWQCSCAALTWKLQVAGTSPTQYSGPGQSGITFNAATRNWELKRADGVLVATKQTEGGCPRSGLCWRIMTIWVVDFWRRQSERFFVPQGLLLIAFSAKQI